MNGQFTLIQNRVFKDKAIDNASLRVLLILQSFMDENGICYPSMKTIAKETGFCVRTVIRAINKLIELDYVRRKHTMRQDDSGQGVNLYYINNNPRCDTPSDMGVTPPSDIHVTPIDINKIKNIKIYLKKRTRMREVSKNDSRDTASAANARQKKSLPVATDTDHWFWGEVEKIVLNTSENGLACCKISKNADNEYFIQPTVRGELLAQQGKFDIGDVLVAAAKVDASVTIHVLNQKVRLSGTIIER